MTSQAIPSHEEAPLERIRHFEAEFEYPAAHVCYGQGRWLKKYLGLPAWIPLHVHMDHSIYITDAPTESEKRTRLPLLTSRRSRQRQLAEICGLRSVVCGTPFVFCRWLNRIEQNPDARGTMAFPVHSTALIDVVADWDTYADALLALPGRFHPIRVCLYWKDFSLGRDQAFRRRGIEVCTSGHIADPDFALHFYRILSSAAYATSNHVGSYSYYAVEMGIPFFIHGESPSFHNFGNDYNSPKGLFYLEGEEFRELEEAREMFSFDLSQPVEITDRLRTTVREKLGEDAPLEKGRLRRVILFHAPRALIPMAADFIRRRLFGLKRWAKWALRLARASKSFWVHGVFGLVRYPLQSRVYLRALVRTALTPPAALPLTGDCLALPSARLEDIIPGCESAPVSLEQYRPLIGSPALNDAIALCRIIRVKKPHRIFLIGVSDGIAAQVAANAPGDCEMLALSSPSGASAESGPLSPRIRRLIGDEGDFDFSSYYEQVDMIVVGAWQDYASVKSDSYNAIKMIAPEGVAVWLHYNPGAPDVVRVLDKLRIDAPLTHVAGGSLVAHLAAGSVERRQAGREDTST